MDRPICEYRCGCGYASEQLMNHSRQGYGICPRCWSSGTERIPTRIFKVLHDHETRKIDRHAPEWLP